MLRNTPNCLVAALAALALQTAVADEDAKSKSDPQEHRYVATVSHIVCEHCKEHVKAAFSKLAGVISVKINSSGMPGAHDVTLVSTSGDLTKSDAVKSLGPYAARYEVEAWTQKTPK